MTALAGIQAEPKPGGAAPHARFLDRIPFDFARRHLLLAVNEADGPVLLVAPITDPAAVHSVGVRLGEVLAIRELEPEALAAMVEGAYEQAARDTPQAVESGDPGDEIADLVTAAERDLLSTSGKGPVVRLVDALLFEAARRSASDVHVQPTADLTLVRFRVDGVLLSGRELPRSLAAGVTSRIKVMGRMDIAETRVPQDGRATVTIGSNDAGRSIDLRISTLPTSHGERVVIRLLDTDRGRRLADLDAIGMPPDVRTPYRRAAARPNGIVLLTGPTGSGKTTTLYATLRWIAAEGGPGGGGDLNIMTIEDPVEYELSAPGVAISQSQVNTKKGVTFASGLRHILRQDPDVVMVGEIRDAETARIAIQASLTGHLVFSTLHTNDAVGAATRLIDLGAEPYLVSASLTAVLAQRLVRRVHAACGGAGCEACNHTGHQGRTGLFELLVVNEAIRDLILRSAPAAELRRAAERSGLRSLREDGLRLVREGITTLTEVERVTTDLDLEDPA